jgi:hypothetical protein
MAVLRPGLAARDAVDEFLRELARRELAVETRRVRGHFLDEFLHHAEEAAGGGITAADLLDPARADAWLADAAAGRTRSRNTMRGPAAAAYPNSMRVRVDSYNAFAEFFRGGERRDSERPAPGYQLSRADTERLLHDLAVRRPMGADRVTALRTAAVAALVADTDRSVPELAGLSVGALHLEGAASVDLADGPSPLRDLTVEVLRRWLTARAEIIAELEGSDPGHLWIPTKPGRPRGGREPVKPGLKPAAVRTLHAAHRTLVGHVLGVPLRPGAIRAQGPGRAERPRRQPPGPQAGGAAPAAAAPESPA